MQTKNTNILQKNEKRKSRAKKRAKSELYNFNWSHHPSPTHPTHPTTAHTQSAELSMRQSRVGAWQSANAAIAANSSAGAAADPGNVAVVIASAERLQRTSASRHRMASVAQLISRIEQIADPRVLTNERRTRIAIFSKYCNFFSQFLLFIFKCEHFFNFFQNFALFSKF